MQWLISCLRGIWDWIRLILPPIIILVFIAGLIGLILFWKEFLRKK